MAGLIDDNIAFPIGDAHDARLWRSWRSWRRARLKPRAIRVHPEKLPWGPVRQPLAVIDGPTFQRLNGGTCERRPRKRSDDYRMLVDGGINLRGAVNARSHDRVFSLLACHLGRSCIHDEMNTRLHPHRPRACSTTRNGLVHEGSSLPSPHLRVVSDMTQAASKGPAALRDLSGGLSPHAESGPKHMKNPGGKAARAKVGSQEGPTVGASEHNVVPSAASMQLFTSTATPFSVFEKRCFFSWGEEKIELAAIEGAAKSEDGKTDEHGEMISFREEAPIQARTIVADGDGAERSERKTQEQKACSIRWIFLEVARVGFMAGPGAFMKIRRRVLCAGLFGKARRIGRGRVGVVDRTFKRVKPSLAVAQGYMHTRERTFVPMYSLGVPWTQVALDGGDKDVAMSDEVGER
ncbi:hypothetical protein OF83DRAFT_1083661 [Amylostereum chailletii]|nr:hypothetical protein OF83DRAFT_1083661 [Amylostereum chailletii]